MENLQLQKFLERRNLVCQRKNGLILFDYNKTVSFEFDWDEITINARGIVFDESTGKIVARPLRKFWNYEELQDEARASLLPERYRPNFKGKYMVLEKADGSCGICYFHDGNWSVNTRGSFESDQAIWATEYLYANLRTDLMNRSKTYIFEVIYPDNRIVVDYGDKEALVLITAIDTQTGEELWYDEIQKEAEKIGCEMVKVFQFDKFEDLFMAREGLTVNEEGFVITFENGYKFKLKGEAYCNVHRKMCALTPLHFWRAFDVESFSVPTSFLSELPEEFKETVDSYRDITESLHNAELKRVLDLASSMPQFSDAKERYMHLTANLPQHDVPLVLGVLTNKMGKLKDTIHRSMRPDKNKFPGVEMDKRLERIMDES